MAQYRSKIIDGCIRYSTGRGRREHVATLNGSGLLDAMARLAVRLPAAAQDAMAWFAELSADPDAEPTVRLAAVVQRARCAPQQVTEDIVATVIGLLRQIPPPRTDPGPGVA